MVAGRGETSGTRAGQGRPADACPYRRPFPADFHDCPAYHPAWFVPLTTGYDSMSPVWTCSNLVAGALPTAAARFYGRCRLGDEAARARWVQTLHARRLAALRPLAVELTAETASLTGELTALKGAQLQVAGDEAERERATERLRELSGRWLAGLDAFLDRRGGEMRALGFPPEAVRVLCADLIDTWIAQDHSGPPSISDDALRLFPEDVRLLLRPGGADGEDGRGAEPAGA
jgi:hypothetical protein